MKRPSVSHTKDYTGLKGKVGPEDKDDILGRWYNLTIYGVKIYLQQERMEVRKKET